MTSRTEKELSYSGLMPLLFGPLYTELHFYDVNILKFYLNFFAGFLTEIKSVFLWPVFLLSIMYSRTIHVAPLTKISYYFNFSALIPYYSYLFTYELHC